MQDQLPPHAHEAEHLVHICTYSCFNIPVLGTPDPPKNLSYNDRVVIESSVNLQWTRPSYTGGRGVAVMKYSVSVNGRRLEVADSSYSVSYTTSYLVYGDVMVSAINTCGQESQPAAINIPAAGDCTASVKIPLFMNTMRNSVVHINSKSRPSMERRHKDLANPGANPWKGLGFMVANGRKFIKCLQ